MESSSVIIDDIIQDIMTKIIGNCYNIIIDYLKNLDTDQEESEIDQEIKGMRFELEESLYEVINCKTNDIIGKDINNIQNIIQEKDEKIKETENKLKEIQDINIKLTTEFNKLLNKLHK